MRKLVEGAEEIQAKATSHEASSGRDRLRVHLRLLDEDLAAGVRALKLWSNFLYGQPVSVPTSDWPENHRCVYEFEALLQVHKLGLTYGHLDAVDASIDAVRGLLHQGNDLYWPGVLTSSVIDVPVAQQVLMDFVMYGEQGDHYTELVDASISPFDACSDDLRAFLRITNELLKMFVQKGKDELAGRPKPDLMARCRYHTHTAQGQSCYLEK